MLIDPERVISFFDAVSCQRGLFYDTVSQTVIESCDTVLVSGELESNWKEAFVA